MTSIQPVRLYNLSKGGNQSLCQPEAEDQLGSGHQELGDQALEQTERTLVLEHLRNNLESTLGVVEVAVLDTGLDHVEGSGNDQGGASTGDGSHKVLAPGGFVVVAQVVNVFLGESGSSEKLGVIVSSNSLHP